MISHSSLLHLSDILTHPILPITWDIVHFLPSRRRCVIYGEYGALKTWLLLDMALHLVIGEPWLGHEVPLPKSVLFIDEEMAEEDLRRRLKLLADGLPQLHGEPKFAALSRAGVTFDTYGALKLLKLLENQQFNPDIVIVESFTRVMPGNENLAGEVAAFWRNLEPISREKTLVMSHHMSKPQDTPRDVRNRARGSVDILAGSDVAWALLIGEPGKTTEMVCVKQRSEEMGRGFTVQLQADALDSSVRLSRARDQKSPEPSFLNFSC